MMKPPKRITKGGMIFYRVFQAVLAAQFVVNTMGLFIFKTFPPWLFRPMAFIYWLAGCLAIAGLLVSKLGLDNEYKG